MVNSRNMKMTPVGLIPEDWNVIQLADYIVDINDGPFGSNLKSEHYTLDREVRIIQLGNVGDNGWNDENVKYTTFEHASTLKRCIVPYGTIIIAKMMPAGRAIICPSSEPAYIQGSDVIKVVFTDSIDKDFFIYLTKSKAYLEQIESGVQGSTRARTNIGKLKSLKLPLPSVEEQKRIASALLSVDKIVGVLDEAIAKKRQIKEGLMQQLLTGKTRLPGFSGEWKDWTLGEVASVRSGFPFKSETYSNTGRFSVITIANVQNGYLNLDECNKVDRYPKGLQDFQKLKLGDILISMTGNVGRVCLVSKQNCLLNQRVGFIEPKGIISKGFLFALLNSYYFENAMIDKGQGAAQANLSNKDIETYAFSAPKSIEEQDGIARALQSMDAEIDSYQFQRNKYALIKQGMMQELLTGKTRLI